MNPICGEMRPDIIHLAKRPLVVSYLVANTNKMSESKALPLRT